MKLRDQAFSIRIDDGKSGGVTEFYSIGDQRLFVIAENGVFEVITANSLDPNEKNPNLPHVHQRVLGIGSSDPRVCRILLTANAIFKPNVLIETVDIDGARLASLECIKEIVFLSDAHLRLKSDETAAVMDLPEHRLIGSAVQLPHISNLESLTHSYVLGSERVYRAIEKLVRACLKDSVPNKWVDFLIDGGMKKTSKDANARKQVEEVGRFLKLVNELRNAAVHPKLDVKLSISDFRLGDDGKIYPPTIALGEPGEAIQLSPLSEFMNLVNESLVNSIEAMIVWLGNESIKNIGMLEPFVDRNHEGAERENKSSYRLYVNWNGKICPYA